ncbi:MAG: ABC transporter ATP-binding protein [Nocardioides sp.]
MSSRQPSDLLRVLRAPVRAHRWALGGASALAVVRIAADLARPWPLALAIDHAIDGRPAPGPLAGVPAPGLLVLAGVATVLLTSLAGLLESANVSVGEKTAERIGAELRGEVFRQTMRLSLRWHARIRGGELTSRLTTDVGRLLDAVVATTNTVVPELLALIGIIVVLGLLDPVLAGVGIAVIPVLVALSVRQRREVRASQLAARRESGRLAGATTTLVRNVPAVQAFDRADQATAEFDARNQAVLAVELDAVATEARWLPRADIVLSIGTAAVLVWGGLQVLDGQQSTGHLLVVIAYLRELYAPVRGLTRLSATLAKAGASAERVAEILDADDVIADRPGARPLRPGLHDLEFDEVGFAYSPDRIAVHGTSFAIAPGEMVCLTGASGAGKSTLLLLSLRLYDVDAGAIRIDGTDIRDYALASLREHIAYVPQDPWLLDATIAQNIAFGSKQATRAGVLRAGEIAGVDEFADRLPLGYDTPLGEDRVRLSGGQRRRVALARAAVSPAGLVLLDEPTASLDRSAAIRVAEAIRSATAGRTTLVVSHDPLLVDLADRVVSLDVAPAQIDPELTQPILAGSRLSGRR